MTAFYAGAPAVTGFLDDQRCHPSLCHHPIGVFVGFGALALDGGRYMSTKTQMQAAADALALAGARELNQQPGARTRAANAMDAIW